MRAHLLDDQALVRAVASGRQRGQEARWKRVELRYVDLKAGRHLQVTAYDETQAHTSNHAARRRRPRDAVDDLLDQPFANWHVETTTEQHQVRVTKKLEAMVHTSARDDEVEVERGHDKAKARLLPEDDPVLMALGHLRPAGPDQAEPAGEVPPGRGVPPAARQLDHRRARAGALRRPTVEEPLRIVDLGCGNAYLTFAAHRYLTHVRGLPVTSPASTSRSSPASTTAASPPRSASTPDFVVGTIAARQLDRAARGGARAARLRHRDRRGAGPGGRVGGRRWCWPRRAATTTSPPSCAATPPPRRTPCSPGTASSASGSPTP